MLNTILIKRVHFIHEWLLYILNVIDSRDLNPPIAHATNKVLEWTSTWYEKRRTVYTGHQLIRENFTAALVRLLASVK